MKLEAKCKICGQTVSVIVDAAYDGVGDPYKLLPMAVHNRCLDIHNARESAGRVLYRCCLELMLKPKDHARLKLVTQITRATQKYARALADQHRAPAMVWDAALPEEIISRPESWRKTMNQYTARALAEFRRPATAAAPPYAD